MPTNWNGETRPPMLYHVVVVLVFPSFSDSLYLRQVALSSIFCLIINSFSCLLCCKEKKKESKTGRYLQNHQQKETTHHNHIRTADRATGRHSKAPPWKDRKTERNSTAKLRHFPQQRPHYTKQISLNRKKSQTHR